MQRTSFQYRPLVEPDAIRLLLIKPAQSVSEPVECNILHVTLSACDREIIDHYTALSYVWGDASQTGQIILDGTKFTLTATLEAALRSLRDPHRVLRLWADALCIDQSNVDERNQQVRQMAQIYSTADHTVVYLGPLTAQARLVLEAVPNSLETFNRPEERALPQVIAAAKSDLLSRPWFARVWVFQEVVLSRDPWVQCGSMRVRWTDICDLLLPGNSRFSRNDPDSTGGLKLLKEMQHAREGRAETTLFNLLLLRRGLGATDARDLIFAHYGIASDKAAMSAIVKVDYQKTLASVYNDTARYFLSSEGPESMLLHIDAIDPDHRRGGLASWAPDWSLTPSYSVPMYKNDTFRVFWLRPELYYIFIEKYSVLAYMGYELDVISHVSHPLPRKSLLEPLHRERYELAVAELQALYGSVGGSYASGDEFGQYTHMPLQGKEAEHETLCHKICNEWLYMMDEELLQLSPAATEGQLESHRKFLSVFQPWLLERAGKLTIFVGADATGFEHLMYLHLLPAYHANILPGRRLAAMQSGRMGVVPAQAREGDVIAYLAGNPICVVIRGITRANAEPMHRIIKETFEARDAQITNNDCQYVKSFVRLFEEQDVVIQHGLLLGESYVEGRVGWAVNQDHDTKIFALH